MPASSPPEVSKKLLRKLHQIHLQRSDLEGQARRGPLQLKAIQSKVDEAESEVNEAVDRLKNAKMTADEKQLQLKTRESQVEDLQRKLNSAASNKEFDLLKSQIAADQQANAVQSDEIFEVLERIDVLEEELNSAQGSFKKTKEDHAQRAQEIEKRLLQIDEDLERVKNQLVDAEKEIPVAIRSDYRRLIEARGEEALAVVENGSCSGCYQTLTTQIISQVMLSKLTYCPNCNAILYPPTDGSLTSS